MMDESKYTPRQIAFAENYFLASSPTYGNAYQSAINAGFSKATAKNITTRDYAWIRELKSHVEKGGNFPLKKGVLEHSAMAAMYESLHAQNPKIRQDSAKFILKTMPEFSEKHDLTSGEEAVNVALVAFKN